MKQILLCLIILMISRQLFAPVSTNIIVEKLQPIRPFEKIWNAICKVESNNDSLAYCIDSNGLPSVGIAQIQESRLNDYNNQSGDSLTMNDMFHPLKAKKVFIWYADKINPGDEERICREWNGGCNGMKYTSTIAYYQKIRNNLCNYCK